MTNITAVMFFWSFIFEFDLSSVDIFRVHFVNKLGDGNIYLVKNIVINFNDNAFHIILWSLIFLFLLPPKSYLASCLVHRAVSRPPQYVYHTRRSWGRRLSDLLSLASGRFLSS